MRRSRDILFLQVYVGDYVEVTDESSYSGSSLGEVVELYQDPAVSAVSLLSVCAPYDCAPDECATWSLLAGCALADCV